MLAPRLKGFLRSDWAVLWRRRLTRLAGYGTAGYPEPVRRRLRIMNVAAYLIAAFTLVYTIEQVILDFEVWKPVIYINLVLIAVALAAPLLHRFNDIAGALTLAIAENIGLFVLTYILGTGSGLHMQYFAAVAGYFVVFGLGRMKLILSLIVAGFVLHMVAWTWFTPERALLHVRPFDLDELYVTAVVTTTAMVAAVVYYAFRLAEQAQEETDTLLHNILPSSIVDRLKGAPGAIIADEVADASVLFADLKGFVTLAKRLGPARTVGLLNIVVSAFDDLADQWRVEKIKTIGDAYMAAAGIPEPAPDHAERLAGMALAMHAALTRISRDQDVALALRIGIATGPVLAGVIGARRLTYDVWGDTVNLASRLEGQSQPGRVLVSRATKTHLEPRFALELCGPLDIKGFGLEEAWYVVEELQPHELPAPVPSPRSSVR
jgi:adenylate cyclase